ncbi:MAG: hypothetical protein WA323_13325 [Candidatus Nitrosopolaris sp.]
MAATITRSVLIYGIALAACSSWQSNHPPTSSAAGSCHKEVKILCEIIQVISPLRQARVNSSIARIFEFSASFISSNASGTRG